MEVDDSTGDECFRSRSSRSAIVAERNRDTPMSTRRTEKSTVPVATQAHSLKLLFRAQILRPGTLVDQRSRNDAKQQTGECMNLGQRYVITGKARAIRRPLKADKQVN